jgi:tRNA A-37 threonylcarbamoyl transferase component Bud32
MRVLRGEQWAARLLQRLATVVDLRQWMKEHTRILKRNDNSLVGLLALSGELNYLKLYQSKSALQSAAFRLGKGRAVHSYDVSQELVQLGVPVPQPRACLQAGSQLLLLKQGLSETRDLNSLWLQGMDSADQALWMQRCGEVLGHLHREGFAHGDAKWTNLLCQHERLWLVDLDGVSRSDQAAMYRDLARFTLNAEDRELDRELFEAFLDSYLRHTGTTRKAATDGLAAPLKKLRQRHLQQYGPRGRRLID